MARRGRLFVVSGPSGAGKSTLIQKLFEAVDGLSFSVSMTTRQPRPGERNAVDYLFVDEGEFRRAVGAGEMLEHAEVHGHHYGTPRAWVERQRDQGLDVLLDIDVQGAEQIRAAGDEAVFVMITPPSAEVLERRLRARRTESEADLQRRLETARQELDRKDLFDYEVVNDALETAFDRFRAIVVAERCRIIDHG
jgi:guanylate kinase